MNTVFLSAGIGAWYPKGVDRLRESLEAQGWPYHIKAWKDEWPDSRFPSDCPYTMKAAAFQWAIDNGYEVAIWGDASVTAVRPITAFVDAIKANGYWVGQSGYNCAQVCPDRMLAYFGVSRDEAENMHDTATGLFGVNLNDPVARVIIETWIKAGLDGAFAGSRLHGGQSADRRFLFCRQDQAALSLVAGKMGIKLGSFQAHVTFAWDVKAGQEFHCQGM